MNHHQLALFSLNEFESGTPGTPVHDPYWDKEEPTTAIHSGDELEQYKFSESSPGPLIPQFHYGSAPEQQEALEQFFAPEQYPSVREQVSLATETLLRESSVREQVAFDTKKNAPEHEKPVHWVEKYWVKRGGNKHWYYRYMYMLGRKICRVHIGSTRSPRAIEKVELVKEAISAGSSPVAIQEMILVSSKSG